MAVIETTTENASPVFGSSASRQAKALTRTTSAPGMILHRSVRREFPSLPRSDETNMRAPDTVRIESEQAPAKLARMIPVRLTRAAANNCRFYDGVANGALAALGFLWVLLFLTAFIVEVTVAIRSNTFGRRDESNRVLSITAFHLFIVSQVIFFLMEALRLVSTKFSVDRISRIPRHPPTKRQHIIINVEANNALLGMILESANLLALILYGGISGPWITNRSNGLDESIWWYLFLGMCFLAVFFICNFFALVVSCVHGRFRFNGERDPQLTTEEGANNVSLSS